MTTRFTSGKMKVELSTAPSASPQKASDESPFRIAILGDFSGRANRGICRPGSELAGRRPIAVDVDNLEELPARLGAELSIPLGGPDGPRVNMSFAELDDFHPDRIFDRLEIFQKLKSLRKRLQDQATFPQAAAEVRSWAAAPPSATTADPTPPADGALATGAAAASGESEADALSRLLGKPPAAPARAPAARANDTIEALIRQVVAPYIVPSPDPQRDQIIAQVDQAISGQMRAILHHGDFQRLEAAWRALHLVVSQCETDETLQIFLLDVSKEELAADAPPPGGGPAAATLPPDIRPTGLYRLLVDQTIGVAGAEPWTLLLGCYTFDKTEADLALLRRLTRIAQAAGAPFLAAAHSHFAGCESVAATPDPHDWHWQPAPAAAAAWHDLRRSEFAPWLGLALPRLLMRLPYGPNTESIERFDFEENPQPIEHERYLWGNPAALCVVLLAAAFRQVGWTLTGALRQEVAGLPTHTFTVNREKRVTPPAEAVLTERAMQDIVERGLIPMLSIKGRDAVRFARYQSVAAPARALAGRWR